jgi:hypothetical protein
MTFDILIDYNNIKMNDGWLVGAEAPRGSNLLLTILIHESIAVDKNGTLREGNLL